MLLKGRCIFIVEDNPQNRVVFTMALKLHGATIEFDRWGGNSIFHLSAFDKVDLIILDLMLPGGVSGYDIHDNIRCLPRYRTVPIIAVSGAEPSIALPKAQRHGFDGFIAKPIDVDLFPKQVAKVIGGEPVWFMGEHYEGTTA
jgi:CheY-like chemotaxis protein